MKHRQGPMDEQREVRRIEASSNPDGLIHNEDGSTETWDDGVVSNVQRRKRDPKQEEIENRRQFASNEIDGLVHNPSTGRKEHIEGPEVGGANGEQSFIKNRLRKANPFDGTIHMSDGSREFIEGGKVGGVNNSYLDNMVQRKHYFY